LDKQENIILSLINDKINNFENNDYIEKLYSLELEKYKKNQSIKFKIFEINRENEKIRL
jgi:hypothetical protein